ncbi:type I-F CRISPR-associated protein Csy1 [Pseudomonas sp. 20P_3.2_Bac4]|uniref:type I-F CRISPR-associated protein Csy1 n=1 Tax=Pseudomonas sp. 20P_3.2_Bac4 TaxID=2971620 RepID=UPI0021C79080|nr:type I-F CRISPR-associated protein Csy1 [Pseudomonas sp. 20P_3.2_Bac4]MCU1730788.1 type I-F CRISPR-associated protein Csy1 [Pseudomonas sp. 20P_3.2_Bac4]
MKEGPESIPRTTLFRTTIASFITERKEAKLKGAETDDDTPVAAKYDYVTWLADAARRVSQIQAVTHVLKATHPDARGTSLHVEPSSLVQHAEVGSHELGNHYATDIVGNAAALDVYKFLKVEVEGRQLLEWFRENDPDLLTALHENAETANEWADAFKNLIRPGERISTHEMAKQVYWSVSGDPADDAGFHLLQPLFPSSLMHAVHLDINDARFGERNKIARQAWRDKTHHSDTYRDYRELVARKLGGTKPQNISQLNSDRGGVNYLLGSLPPTWGNGSRNPLLTVDSAFRVFRRFDGVSTQLKALCTHLESNPEAIQETRLKRERIERALGRSLAAFAHGIRNQFTAGWTTDSTCELPLCQQLWLDPQRGQLAPRQGFEEEDQAFAHSTDRGDWTSEVAKQFGLWLNDILKKRGLPVSHTEHTHWAGLAATYLTPLARDLEAQHG